MPVTRTRDELLSELEQDGDSYFSGGFWNNIIDLSLTIVTVVASLVATVLATMDKDVIPRWVVAAVASIPAAATALQRIVGIRERSNWYYFYPAQLRSLARQLKYATAPNVEEFGNKYADLQVIMEERWTNAGHSGAASSGRRTNAPVAR